MQSRADQFSDLGDGNLTVHEALPHLERLGIAGLTASATRENVEAVLGPPQLSGGVPQQPAHGCIRPLPWIKYLRPDCQVRFEFGDQGALVLVSILPAGWPEVRWAARPTRGEGEEEA
jgi:hypothetical protein